MTGVRRGAAPTLPVPCSGSAPLVGAVQAPAFENCFVRSLSEPLDCLAELVCLCFGSCSAWLCEGDAV